MSMVAVPKIRAAVLVPADAQFEATLFHQLHIDICVARFFAGIFGYLRSGAVFTTFVQFEVALFSFPVNEVFIEIKTVRITSE